VSEGYEEGDFDRGRHAVIADHCDLASVARIEDVYAGRWSSRWTSPMRTATSCVRLSRAFSKRASRSAWN
jgi:hypothetical protein